ncbi:unnamed protein product [Lasius platythorax]|uniref:Uncharacterized protein n=1 Tax=Lasius platythorax TaxID=488582 RepID=A0AAV2NA09_9HYME
MRHRPSLHHLPSSPYRLEKPGASKVQRLQFLTDVSAIKPGAMSTSILKNGERMRASHDAATCDERDGGLPKLFPSDSEILLLFAYFSDGGKSPGRVIDEIDVTVPSIER